MACFHRRVWVGSVCKGAAWFHFHLQKWAGSGLSRTHLAVLLRQGTNGAFPLERVGRCGVQRCDTDHVSTAKSGRDPD